MEPFQIDLAHEPVSLVLHDDVALLLLGFDHDGVLVFLFEEVHSLFLMDHVL